MRLSYGSSCSGSGPCNRSYWPPPRWQPTETRGTRGSHKPSGWRGLGFQAHRLSLYSAIEDAAKKEGDPWRKTHLNQLCIESFNGTTGHPAAPEAWNSATKESNNILISRLDSAKKLADSGDIAAYKIYAQSICTDFRKLLERTVENDLLNDVVKRHRRSVTTDNRIGALSKITRDDCKYIDDLMTKYSCYEHSQSQEGPPAFIPDEAELRIDLVSLKTWRGTFKERAA